MAEVTVPLSITYETKGLTPLADVIRALQAAEIAIEDSISLLPSLIDGLQIQSSSVNVRMLSQESPLRELFAIGLFMALQDDLKTEIPPMIETLLNVEITDQYDSIVTLVTAIVLFYGAAFLKDAAVKAVDNGALRRQVDGLIAKLALDIGKSEDEVRQIFDAKYSKPGPVKRLTKAVQRFFIPSQREGAVPITFDRARVENDVIRDVPYAEEFEAKEDFERYTPHYDVMLEIHAQDKDKINTGWAAVPKGISDRRLRMKLVEPVAASDLWTRDTIKADIVIVSKLTSDGYAPSEIHLTKVHD